MEPLDAIEALDWGAYAHFKYDAEHQPLTLQFMQVAYYFSDYVAIGVLFSLAAFLFVMQGKHRSAHVTAAGLVVALAVIFSVHFLVPRLRPPAAQA